MIMPHSFATFDVKKLGRAAMFCPFCRDVKPFIVRELRWVTKTAILRRVLHIHHSLGEDFACQACKAVFVADLGAQGIVPSKNKFPDMTALAKGTNPALMASAARRLQAESDMRAGRLNKADRQYMIAEPIQFLAKSPWLLGGNTRSPLQFKIREPRITNLFGILIAMGVTFSILGCVVAFMNIHPLPSLVASGIGLGIGLGIAIVGAALTWLGFYLRRVSTRRAERKWIRKWVYPNLARAYALLRPTAPELEQVLQTMRQSNLRIGLLLDVNEIERRSSDAAVFAHARS